MQFIMIYFYPCWNVCWLLNFYRKEGFFCFKLSLVRRKWQALTKNFGLARLVRFLVCA